MTEPQDRTRPPVDGDDGTGGSTEGERARHLRTEGETSVDEALGSGEEPR